MAQTPARLVCGRAQLFQKRFAFTLIEVLVVVAIIALLVSILVPSLTRAREQARTIKCLSNMSNMPKAVLAFATEHGGYAQLIGEPPEWRAIDPSMTKYDYQDGGFGQTGPWLKPWAVAYAKQLGFPSLKRMENYFTPDYQGDPAVYFKSFGRHDIFICPSDKVLVHDTWSPHSSAYAGVYGIMSYSANEDVFGVTGVAPGGTSMSDQEGQPWKDGLAADTKPARARRLEGRMDSILRPSEVALFCDGGNEDWPKDPALLITNGNAWGPYLENYEYACGRLPHFRHSEKGGLAVGLADGSGKFLNPLSWTTNAHLNGKVTRFVTRYTPRIRVSPYNVGTLPAQPGP
jgi:prepilin-type N-terminal cleavage/methylation domain-containing protein